MSHRIDSRNPHTVGTARLRNAWVAASLCLFIASYGAAAAQAAPVSRGVTVNREASRSATVPAMSAPFGGQSGSMPLPDPFLVAPTCGSHCLRSAPPQPQGLPEPIIVAPISCGNACGIRSRSADAGQRATPRLGMANSQSDRDMRLLVAGGDPPTVVDGCAGRKCRG